MEKIFEKSKKKVRSVIIFGVVEIAVLLLFLIFMAGNFFVARGVADRRTRQIVEDNYSNIISDLMQDIKNVSQAGYTLIVNETVTRLKAYYYDLILEDSYARNTALNNTISALVSLVTYYDILDACALWIAPGGGLSYNTLYTFVGDDARKQLLDSAISSHEFSPTYDGAVSNRGGKIILTLSLSQTDGCVLALLLDTDCLEHSLALTAMPRTQTDSDVIDGKLYFFCTSGEADITGAANLKQTEKPVLENGEIIYRTQIAGAIPLCVLFKASSLDSSLSVYMPFFIAGCLMLCAVALAFFLTFRHFFNRPFNRILEAMGEVSKGNFDVRIDESISSDFQYVYDGFNFMTSSISGYIEENYRQKVMRTESEFKALQAQINPHFLYNCFANIRSFCKMGDVDSVEKMTDRLAKVFLYITRNSEPIVTLKDEVGNMLNYLEIQQIRFGDRVALEIDNLSERLAGIKIPKLCLQPIAENAYKYAFAETESGGVFKVSFDERGEELRIVMEDNGAYLTDGQLEEISRALESSEEASGLVNVCRRLEHYAGGRGRLSVERSGLGGLCVIICLNSAEGGNDGDDTRC